MSHSRPLHRSRSIVLAIALSLAVGLLAALPALRAQSAVGSSFTFQGDLTSAGSPVSGTRHMKFRLYDAVAGGTQIGSELTATAVTLDDGKFTVQLDFGTPAFAGQARWLEIDISDGASGPPFTTLAPRHRLTAAPYAIYALSAPAPQQPIACSINASFSQDDRSGWAHVETLGDDTCFPNIPLGFTFTGWSRNNSTVTVSSNGLLFFGFNCSTEWNNASLPSSISVDPFLAFFWDDLADGGTGQYFEYATFGTSPGRVFNLYFRNRLLSTVCGTDSQNIMVSIYEGSNTISVTYSGFSTCANMRGSTATIGLQGPGGAAATSSFLVSHNSPILDDNANRQTISFTPPRQ